MDLVLIVAFAAVAMSAYGLRKLEAFGEKQDSLAKQLQALEKKILRVESGQFLGEKRDTDAAKKTEPEIERAQNSNPARSVPVTGSRVAESASLAPPLPENEASEAAGQAEFEPTEEPATLSASASPAPSHAELAQSFEEKLSTRWIVWAGGVVFALGSAFLVKYSIDIGLLSPAVRLTLASFLGLVMVVFGDIMRQRGTNLNILKEAPDYVPSAICGAGTFTLFAAIYAAFELYGFLSPAAAFIMLAGVSGLASWLSLSHGRFFAGLGIVGGLLVPALVASDASSPWILFPYLLLIVGVNVWIARQRAWVEIALPTLVLASFWGLVWIVTSWTDGDALPVGGYLIILTIMASWMARGASPERASDPTVAGLFPTHPVTPLLDLFLGISTLMMVTIVRLDMYGATGLALMTVFCVLQAYAVWRSAEHDTAGLTALVGLLVLLSTWHIPDLFAALGGNSQLVIGDYPPDPVPAPDLSTFLIAAFLIGAVPSALLFLGLPRLLRGSLWSSVSAALPVLALIIAYLRLVPFEQNIPFFAAALGLSAVLSLGASQMRGFWAAGNPVPIAAYSAGAVMALALSLAILLREAWLSVALSLELVALGYIWRKTKAPGLRVLALGLAATVLVRLFFNPAIFDYQGGGVLPTLNWVFLGYGLTSALFYLAFKLFKDEAAEDTLQSVLQAGALLLLMSFITLELRVLASEDGSLLGSLTQLEVVLQTLNWSVASLILMWRELKEDSLLFGALRRFMTLVSLVGLVMGGLYNTVYLSTNVSGTIFLNMQTLQILLPALIYGAKAWLMKRYAYPKNARLYGGLAFLLVWFWLGAEVEFWFDLFGDTLAEGWRGYLYSLAWLLYALSLLFAGLWANISDIRKAGFVVLAVVVLKVFLLDMSNLEGLARALSFLGLGAALIGTGYLYQRLQKRPPG